MPFTPRNRDASHSSRSHEDSFFKPRVQTKLAIGRPGDRYEVEADKTADSVVSKLKEPRPAAADQPTFFAPKPVVQAKKQEQVQPKEDASQEKEEIQEKPLTESITPLVQTSLEPEEPVQEQHESSAAEQESAKAGEDTAGPAAAEDTGTPVQQKKEGAGKTADLGQQLSASKGGGQPMNQNTQAEMSRGFGADFSNVRVHTDSNAVQMNKDLGSHAFANGSDVYFNSGKYDPSSDSGKHLLAHELTHTVQQGASGNTVAKKEDGEGEKGTGEKNPAAPTSDPFFEPAKRNAEEGSGAFAQKSGQAVEQQLQKETGKAASEVPVKARIEKGKPTVLEPKSSDNAPGKGLELKEAAGEQKADVSALVADAGVEQKKDPAENPASNGEKAPKDDPAGTAKGKAGKEGKEEKKEGKGESAAIDPVGKALELPALEPDKAVQTIQQLSSQPPSAADRAESQADKRTEEEKMAEQARLAAEFQTRVETVRTTIQQKTALETANVRAREELASETIRQNAAQQIAQIRALVTAKKAELRQGYAQTRQLLEAQKENDLVRVETTKAAKIALLNTEMESRRTGFNAFVDEQTHLPTVNATNEANRADAELESAAAQALAQGESVAHQHPGSDDGNPEARDSVRQIARESAADMRKSKVTIREDLLKTAGEYNGGFEQYRTDIQQQINSTEQQLLTGINGAAESFKQVLNNAYSGVLRSLGEKEVHDLQGLDALEAQQLSAARENKRSALGAVAQIAGRTAEELQRASGYLLQMIDQLGTNVTQLLAPGEGVPLMSAVTELQQNSLGQLDAMESDGTNQLDAIVAQSVNGTDQTLQANVQANESAYAATQQQAAQSVNASALQREQVVTQLRTTLDTSFTSMETALDEMRTNALSGLDKAIEDRKRKMQQANDKFLVELISQNNEHIETAKQPLTDPLISRLWSAADRATASWWEGLLAAIGDFLLMLIIIVAFAALLVLAGVFSTLMGALLVIGAVLLAVMFIGALIDRLMKGNGWMSVPLAIADTLGITMIYQGVTNKDIATGENLNMNTFDRWYSGTTGTLQFITIILPFKSRIPGLRSIRMPRIFGEPNGRGPAGWMNRGVKWIEGVGRNNRTRGGVEQPSFADQAWSWIKSKSPFGSRPAPGPGAGPDPVNDPNANGQNRQNTQTDQPPAVKTYQNGETIVIDDPGRLTFTEPTQEGEYVRWKLYDRETGAEFTHYVKAKATSGPDMFLDPENSSIMQNGVTVKVKLQASGFKWTEIANRLNMEAYVKFFGQRPPNLNGQIWASNLDRFVIKFAEMRAKMPGALPQEIANAAIRETSFGRGKIAEGYGDLRVDLNDVNMVDVTITDKGVARTYENVPSNRVAIDVEALPTKK